MPATTLTRPDFEWAEPDTALNFDDELDDPEADDEDDYGIGEDVDVDEEEDVDLDEEFDEGDHAHDAE